MTIRKKAVVIDGKKRMIRTMTPEQIKERDELNQKNTAESIRRRAQAG